MNTKGHRLNDNTPGKANPRHQENVLIMDLSLDRAAAWIEAVDWNLINIRLTCSLPWRDSCVKDLSRNHDKAGCQVEAIVRWLSLFMIPIILLIIGSFLTSIDFML